MGPSKERSPICSIKPQNQSGLKESGMVNARSLHSTILPENTLTENRKALFENPIQTRGYEETAILLHEKFGYRPGLLSNMLIKTLSKITLPIEEGSYNGKPLPGEPHRLTSVEGTPLTVFAVHGNSWLRRVLLSSRISGDAIVNIIDIEKKTDEKKTGKEKGKKKQSKNAWKSAKVKGENETHKDLSSYVFSPNSPRLAKGAHPLLSDERGEKSGRQREALGDEKIMTARQPGQRSRRLWISKFSNERESREIQIDPLLYLLYIQSESAFSIKVVPVVRASQHSIKQEHQSIFTRVTLSVFPANLLKRFLSFLYNFRTGKISCCPPLHVKDYLSDLSSDCAQTHEARLADLPQAAKKLKTDILNRMVAQHRALSGPPSPPTKNLKQIVLSDPRLVSYMYEYAIQNEAALEDVRKEAEACLKEIASDYNPLVARMFCAVIDYLFNRFLEGIEVDPFGVRLISSADSKSRIVLVCSHKSYIDPLLIGYSMYRSGLMPPQQVAGENLSFFPVGWLLRHCGAFYIRRNFMGETLYREVFEAYVRYLLAKNYTITLYIEGTRSRDGKISHPKLGFMKILKDALDTEVCEDILLVPVYLGYDKVPEEGSHVREMAGGKKVAESVGGFAALYKAVNTTLGRAFVRFGHPVSMRAALADKSLKETAEELCRRIDSLTPLTARACVSVSILAFANPDVDYDTAYEGASFLLECGRSKGIPFVDNQTSVKNAMDWLQTEGYIISENENGALVFRVTENGRRFLLYNANVGIGHFLSDSLNAIACAALLSNAFKAEGYLVDGEDALGYPAESKFFQSLFSEQRRTDSGNHPGIKMEAKKEEDKRHLNPEQIALSFPQESTTYGVPLTHFLKELFDKEFFFEDKSIVSEEHESSQWLKSAQIMALNQFNHKVSASGEGKNTRILLDNPSRNEDAKLLSQNPLTLIERDQSNNPKVNLKSANQTYLLASCLIPFIEAYAISAKALSQLEPGNWFSEDEFLSLCYKVGQDCLKSGAIWRVESLSKPAFLNSAEKFAEGDIIRIRYQKEEDSKRKFAYYKVLDSEELKSIESILLAVARAVYELRNLK